MDGMVNYGILQPGIGNALAAGYQQAQDRQNALMQQQQQRQLGDIQLQNALREQRMAGEEEAAWKEGAGKPEQILQALQQRGLGKQAMALQAQMSKQQADKLTMLKTANDLKKQAATAVMANPTLETALGMLQSFANQTGMDVSSDRQALQSTGGDPRKIMAWAAGHAIEADKMLPQLNTKDTGGQVQDRLFNPVTGKVEVIGTTAKTMPPGQAEQLAISRGQLALAQQKERRVAEQGESVEISPKEIQKREAAYPKATSAVNSFEANSNSFVNDLKKLRDHPGLSSITGVIAGRTPSISKDGRAAQALYDKIVAKGGFQALQALREASTTGGALGSVSNQEGKQLVQSFAAIDQRQDAPDVQAAIDQVIQEVEGTKSRVREAYDMTYDYKTRRGGGKVTPAQPGAPKPTVSNW